MDVQFNDDTTSSSWLFLVVEGPTAYVLQNPAHTYTSPGTHTVTLATRVSGVDCAPDTITVTVAPTPTPNTSASVDPSASPTPSPVPTASPTPRLCSVPSLVGERKNAAQGIWDAADFTTTVALVPGANPNANWWIQFQSLNSGNDVACNVTIEIGPDPQASPTPAP